MSGIPFFFTLLTLLLVASSEGQVQRIWKVALGHDWGAQEYIDSAGFLKGFDIELIDYVCAEGGMDCRIVWDQYKRCWTSNPGTHPTGGIGLFARWYDACTSWAATIERIHTFQFTQAHFVDRTAYLIVLKGRSINVNNVQGKTIGFFNGWAFNEKCLARMNVNYKYTESNSKYYDNPSDVIKALQNGEIDATFMDDEYSWSAEQLKLLDVRKEKAFTCFISGHAMMSRKDSAFTANWNVGFRKLLNTNKFKTFCENMKKNHGHIGEILECVG